MAEHISSNPEFIQTIFVSKVYAFSHTYAVDEDLHVVVLRRQGWKWMQTNTQDNANLMLMHVNWITFNHKLLESTNCWYTWVTYVFYLEEINHFLIYYTTVRYTIISVGMSWDHSWFTVINQLLVQSCSLEEISQLWLGTVTECR